MVLDEALPDASRDHRRDRADDDGPGNACIGALNRAAAERRPYRSNQADDLRLEVDQDRDQRPGMECDVERLVELLVVLKEVIVLQPGDQDQVTGGGDRQELGQPLDDPEHQCLELGHAAADRRAWRGG